MSCIAHFLPVPFSICWLCSLDFMFKAFFNCLVLPSQGSVRMKSEALPRTPVSGGSGFFIGGPLSKVIGWWACFFGRSWDFQIYVSFLWGCSVSPEKDLSCPCLGYSTSTVGALGACLGKGAQRSPHHPGGRHSQNWLLLIQSLNPTSPVPGLPASAASLVYFSRERDILLLQGSGRPNCPLCSCSIETCFSVCDVHGDEPPKSALEKEGLVSAAAGRQAPAASPFRNCLSSSTYSSLVAHIQWWLEVGPGGTSGRRYLIIFCIFLWLAFYLDL